MPAPTSPRKRALMPSSDLRRRLRAAGHALAPVVQLGKLGTTPAIAKQVARALLDHELIKVKLGTECPESRFEVADAFAALPRVKVVQILGRTVLLYQRHPKHPAFEMGTLGRVPKPSRDAALPARPAAPHAFEMGTLGRVPKPSRDAALPARPAAPHAFEKSAPATARVLRQP